MSPLGSSGPGLDPPSPGHSQHRVNDEVGAVGFDDECSVPGAKHVRQVCALESGHQRLLLARSPIPTVSPLPRDTKVTCWAETRSLPRTQGCLAKRVRVIGRSRDCRLHSQDTPGPSLFSLGAHVPL